MFSRRYFLLKSVATLVAGQLISGCSDRQQIFKVLLLQGSIPPQLLSDFRKTLQSGTKLDFEPKSKLNKLFSLLEHWQQQNEHESNQNNNLLNLFNRTDTTANLITLSAISLKV